MFNKLFKPIVSSSQAPRNLISQRLTSSVAAAANVPELSTVYIGNLHYDVKEGDIKEFCKHSKGIVNCTVPLTTAGRIKGYALVQFKSLDYATAAVKELSDGSILGRKVFVRSSETMRKYDGTGYKVSVENLPPYVGWTILKGIFRVYGPLVHTEVEVDAYGRRNGKGFVAFAKIEDAKRALQSLQSIVPVKYTQEFQD